MTYHSGPIQPCGNKYTKGQLSKFERPGLLALPDARGRNRLIPPIDLRSTQRCHPAVECRLERAYLSINVQPLSSHAEVHFPVWGGLRGSSGLEEHLLGYLVALYGVSNQFQDDALRLHPWPRRVYPSPTRECCNQVTGLVSIDLTIVAPDSAVVPIARVS